MDPGTTTIEHSASRRRLALAAAIAAVIALFALLDSIDLLMPAITDSEGGKPKGLEEVATAIDNIKGPATVMVGSLAGLGVLAAAALMAVGGQSGPRIGLLSLGSIFAIALGNGLVA